MVARVVDDEGGDLLQAGDIMGVFVGDELRGIQISMPVPVFLGNGFVFNMLVSSNTSSGEDMTVLYYSAADNAVYNL